MTFQLRLEHSIERRVARWFGTLADDDVCYWCRLNYFRQVATELKYTLRDKRPRTVHQWVRFRRAYLDDATLRQIFDCVVGEGCSPADHYDPDQFRDGRQSDRN